MRRAAVAALLLCLAVPRGADAQTAANASSAAGNSSSSAASPPPAPGNSSAVAGNSSGASPPPTPSASPPPPSPALAGSSSAAALANTTSADALWLLPDNQCQRDCVDVASSPLSWCASQVTYDSFCNRTADGDASWSVARLEEAAQATYAAVVFNLANPPTDECKTLLHSWFFTSCSSDGVTLRPMCRAACASLATSCVVNWLDCDAEVEEARGTAPPWWYDASGAYIRGIKPANASVVPPAARRGLTLDNGGVLGQGPLYSPLTRGCIGAAAGARPAAWALLLAVAHAAAALRTEVER